MVRKIRVILNIKNLNLKSKIKNQKYQIGKIFDILKIPIWQKLFSKIGFLIFDFDFLDLEI